jgi:hypothetical protein
MRRRRVRICLRGWWPHCEVRATAAAVKNGIKRLYNHERGPFLTHSISPQL